MQFREGVIGLNVKEFLQSVRHQDCMLKVYEIELNDLRRRAYNISSPKLGDKVQANHISALDEVVERLEAQAFKVNQALDKLIQMREHAKALIDMESDMNCRCILYRRYILCQFWWQIAREMHYDIRQVFRLHNTGLHDLKRLASRCQ